MNNKALVWNVFVSNSNSRSIKTFNIFEHRYFSEAVEKLFKKAKKTKMSQLDLQAKVRRELMYYFWSKCEWEIILSGWPPSSIEEEKIDVYEQININFMHFFEYLCTNYNYFGEKNNEKYLQN